MIREIATSKGTSGSKGLILIIAVAVTVILLSMLVGYIQTTFGIAHMEYLIYIGLIILGVVLIRRYITQYRYSLFDDEIIFERIIGKKETPALVLRMWEIKGVKSLDEVENKDLDERNILRLNVERKDAWLILYEKDEESNGVIFNPSREFIEQLKKTLKTPQKEETREPDIVT